MYSIRATIAIASSFCIWIAALLQVLQAFNATGGNPPQRTDDFRDSINSLNATSLRIYWAYKNSQLGIDVMIDLLGALGLAGLSYCVLILRRVFKKYKGGDSDFPAFMSAAFFIGAILASIAFLQAVGFTTTADVISNSLLLPDTGIQALHIAFQVDRGSTLYLFSAQFICSSVGLFIASYLTWVTEELSRRHAILGFITSAFGLLVFILEIVAFNAGGASGPVLGVVVLIYGILLLPIWTIWLGLQLRKIKKEEKQQNMFQMNEKLTSKTTSVTEESSPDYKL